MTVVRGTKQFPLRVVRDRPLLRALSYVLLVAVICGTGYLSYNLGHSKGMAGREQALDDVTRLSAALLTRSNQVAELEQQIENFNLGAEIDRQANEDVRQEVIELKDQLAKLQEDNSFYRNLMAPSGNKVGLSFGAVEIVDTDVARQYDYKVVLQQLAVNHQLLNGYLIAKVVGRQNGVEVTLPLKDLSEQVSENRIKLRFKYFQTVQGRLALPEGFEPERLELEATSTGSRGVTVEKRFGWLVEEA
ncbi:DUF6776 family protein [Teredinibacter turnerae]|uniref:DUF6776 family protein n=1 Tax=Teredinibacter turnerae TaxID=2426 RepID=UPI0030D56B99